MWLYGEGAGKGPERDPKGTPKGPEMGPKRTRKGPAMSPEGTRDEPGTDPGWRGRRSCVVGRSGMRSASGAEQWVEGDGMRACLSFALHRGVGRSYFVRVHSAPPHVIWVL